jgi:hypothetical protein
MQRERASIPKVGLIIRSLDDYIEKRVKRDKRVRSLQEISKKPCEEFKTVNSILLTKYCSHHTEISTKDIVTLHVAGVVVIFLLVFFVVISIFGDIALGPSSLFTLVGLILQRPVKNPQRLWCVSVTLQLFLQKNNPATQPPVLG